MEHRLSATELARKVGDVLGRIRYRGDSYLIERNGDPIARIIPLADRPPPSLRELLTAWSKAGAPDPDFADDLSRVGSEDRPPDASWGS